MPTSQGMPPYADIVFHHDIQQLVGMSGTGMLAFLIGRAEPTGTGGWAVYGTVGTLAAAAGMSTNTFTKAMVSLEAAGLIARKKGKRYGPGFGSDPNVYWLTYHPAMIGPTSPGTPTPDRGPSRGDRRNGDLTYRDVIGRDLPPRHLIPVPAHSAALEGPGSEMSNGDVVDALPSTTHNAGHDSAPERSMPEQSMVDRSTPGYPASGSVAELAQPCPLAKAPAFVADALRSVGWTAQVPAHVPLTVLAAVAGDLARRKACDLPGAKSNPAGFLHYLITRGDLLGYAADNRLLASDPAGQLDAYGALADIDGLMTIEEFEQAAVTHGVWAHAVRVEAARIARTSALLTADGKVPQRILREVATRTPLDADTAATRAAGENPF